MRDLDIEFPEHDEPTRIPSGGCEAWERGENCGRTNCEECGEDAAAWLVAAASTGVAGIVALAREIMRVNGSGAQHAVTGRDLARLRDRGPERSHLAWSRSWAWAEGILDAVAGRDQWLSCHSYENSIGDQSAYMIGRLLVELWQVNKHLNEMAREDAKQDGRDRRWLARRWRAECTTPSEIRRKATPSESPVPGKPWIYPDEFEPCSAAEKAARLGITSAAGALPAPRGTASPAPIGTSGAESGPGFESRAQHRGHGVR